MIQNEHHEVRLLRKAEEDLREIVEYIALDNPSAAHAVLEDFENQFDSLSQFPHLGRLSADSSLMSLGYRYLVSGRYVTIYKLEDATVIVFRILHASTDYLNILQGE